MTRQTTIRTLLATILLAGNLLAANGECYIINDGGTYEIMDNLSSSSTKTFDISNPQPCNTLTFSFSKNKIGTNGVTVTATYLDNSTETIINNNSGSDQTYNFGKKIVKSLSFKGNGTLKKSINNIVLTQATYIEPSHNPVDCGTIDVLGSSTDTKFSVAWSNVNPLTLSIDNTTDFSLNATNIASALCNYGTADIKVDFHPQSKGEKTATITIANSDKPSGWTTIAVKGYAKPQPQYIVWWDESVTMLSRGDVVGSTENPFVRASSGLALTELKSSDESVLRIDNGTLTAVAAGHAQIIAYQAGTNIIDEVRDTLFLEVTNLLTQKIEWTQSLNFKWGDAPITLTAESSAGLPITYELADNTDGVVSLSGDRLTISTTATGKATIRAIQTGTAEYAATSLTRTLRVRDPNASCINEPWVLDATAEESFSTISNKEYTLDGSPAGTLSFDAKCQDIMLFWGGDLYVKQYVDGAWSGKIATCKFDAKNTYYHFGPIALDRKATKIQLFTETGATGKKVFKNVQVTRAHFVEADASAIHIDAQFGTTTVKTVGVAYSNLQDIASVTLSGGNTDFTVSPTSFGENCGDYGNIDVRIAYTPSAIASDNETLIIGNDKDGYTHIPITTSVTKRDQNLSWPLRDSIATTQTWILDKVNPVSGLPITYTISDENVLQLDENNQLVFKQAGTTVTITATCPGNDQYNDATPISITLDIFKGLPELTLPTVGNEITYGQTLNEIKLIGGKATTITGDAIEGDFMWTNKNIVPNAGIGIKEEITFVPYNQNIYDNAHDSLAIIVHKQSQNIVWSMPDSIGVMDSMTLDAYASSKLPVSYEIEACSGQPYARIGSDGKLDITATVDALGKELTIKAWQTGNENYLPSDTLTYTVVLRKTRAEFFAATKPITVPKGGAINLSDVEVHVESSVAGTWSFDPATPTTLPACLWIAKGTFTPENQELCEPIEVEIPINIAEE